ncbi:MAG: Uma2 family endonuclease [Chloroflexota bacterium]|nr:Uma2 family endonuclease [Chloroflexota bacterium]
MTVNTRYYTADDLWEISHDPDRQQFRYELSGGVLIEMAPAGGLHGGIASNILVAIENHIRPNKLGKTTAAETGFWLGRTDEGRHVVRAPDVGFIAALRVPKGGLPDGYFQGAPDLAVEVVSSNDRIDEIEGKLADYLDFGTRMIWIVYPKTQTIQVYTAAEIRRLTADDTLDGGDVLPGFALPVRALFE